MKLYLLLSILVISVGLFLFFIGFHNMDLVMNFSHLNVGETTILGKSVSLKEAWIMGLQRLFLGVLLIAIGSFGIGYTIKNI